MNEMFLFISSLVYFSICLLNSGSGLRMTALPRNIGVTNGRNRDHFCSNCL